MKINEVYEVTIVDTDNHGNGIAKINNIVTFIKGTFKEEIVKIKITSLAKRFATGQLIEIIKKSPFRTKIFCPSFYTCGGCNYLHLDFQKENELKEQIIKETFKDYKVNNIIYGCEYYYRNKAVFHVKDNQIGFYMPKTNNIVPITNCLLLNKTIQKIYDQLKTINLQNINNITVKVTSLNETMLIFDGHIMKKDLSFLTTNNKITSIYQNNKLIYGNSYIKEQINDIIFTINKESFMQVNYEIMLKLYDKIKQYAKKGNTLLDLYCGTGTIAIYLKNNYQKIVGVEIVADAIKNANLNKKINNISNVDFILQDASYVNQKNFETIITDPPRAGLSKQVINNLLNSGATKIIYTSCNYKTLQKDIKLLEKKYKVVEITPFNMFPQTDNIECVCLMVKI